MDKEVENNVADDEVLGFLEHFGVKGMRWGVRRKVGPNGRVIGKPRSSTDYKTTAPLRKRPPHTLSNMQLKKVNERMQLEQKFSKMNPSKLERGRGYVDDVLKVAAGAGGIAGFIKLMQMKETKEFIQTGARVVGSRTLSPGKHFAKAGATVGKHLIK